MKKVLSIILTVALIICAVPLGAFTLTASAATSGYTGNCRWTVDGTTLTISGYGKMEDCKGYYGDIILPWGTEITKVIINPGVTSIGERAFSGCSSLEKVNITDIAKWCGINFNNDYYYSNPLYYAHNLYLNGTKITNLVVPDGVTSISNYAFSGCSSLTSVTIPDSVTSIGEYAFSDCSSLTSVTIPDSVTSISNYAFSGCRSLTSATIGNSVTSIGGRAFYGCSSLTSVTIGNSVTSIGGDAFYDCSSLEKVNITDIAKWCGINFSFNNDYNYAAYYSNPLTYAHNLYLNGTKITNLVIPDSVTSIGKYAFYNCSSLTSVTIPDSVTSIYSEAFLGCSSLTSVTIPDSVTSIADEAC